MSNNLRIVLLLITSLGFADGQDYVDPCAKDPTITASRIVVCITAGVLLVFLHMTIFGQRMRCSAIRWHMINCSVWGFLHLANYSSVDESAPYPGWITLESWNSDAGKTISSFTMSVFPTGMIIVYLERIIVLFLPNIEDHIVFKLIFAFIILVLQNVLLLYCLDSALADLMNAPGAIDEANTITYLLFVIVLIIFIIFCFVGTCLCCNHLTRTESKRSIREFIGMWTLVPFGLIPSFIFGPSFGLMATGTLPKLLDMSLMDLIGKFTGGGGGGDGSTDPTGSPGEPGGGGLTIDDLLPIALQIIQAVPWFVLIFPLVQVALAIICVDMFREQFFFLVSCGRLFNEPAGYYQKIASNKEKKEHIA